MKFDLKVVNWLIHVTDPMSSCASFGYDKEDRVLLELVFNKLTTSIFSTLHESRDSLDSLRRYYRQLLKSDEQLPLDDVYAELKDYFVSKQWIALIIPSGMDSTVDEVLCDPQMLGYLVNSSGQSRGLILQLDEAPGRISSFVDVHPALIAAFNDSVNWPGILLWAPAGDSVFLPVSSLNFHEIDIEARMQWVFSQLFSLLSIDFARLKFMYKNAFPEVFEYESQTVKLLHLSDIDIGNDISSFRIFRMEQCIRSLVEELGEKSKIIPVITGNFMNNPSEKHLDKVAVFWRFLSGMGTEQPLLVFGNHDVRKDGNINESYRNAVGFQNSKVSWYETEKLAVISLNTVVHGNLAQGAVGKEQIEAIEYEIERKKGSDGFKFVMLMHHLPISHEGSDDEIQPFYEKIFGQSLSSADKIDGADLLLEFINKYSIVLILHGHQKAPVISQIEQTVSVIGCGRSIGSQSKYDGAVYFSMNVISFNRLTGKTSSRLLAIRKPETGFAQFNRHEVIYRALIQ